jgi:hypothetical protein
VSSGRTRVRFDGHIAGIGTASGTRIVLGHWPRSPFGPVADVMLESSDGRRLLLAGTPPLGEFVAATYRFDEVRVVPVSVRTAGPIWDVAAGPLRVRFAIGGRGPLGLLLRAVPAAVARSPAWIRAVDLPARLVLPGVRTYAGTGAGRRQWYGVQDLRRITAVSASLDGHDLGPLAAVDPPVGFGAASVPRRPALMRVATTVTVARPPAVAVRRCGARRGRDGRGTAPVCSGSARSANRRRVVRR